MTEYLIRSIKVTKLFGLYTYELPATGEFSNAAIIYGDNGVGKSNLLRLTFHLLSAANDKGHRGALYEAHFEQLDVVLSSGIRFTASFSDEKRLKILVLGIYEGTRKISEWRYVPAKSRHELFESESIFYGNELAKIYASRKIPNPSKGSKSPNRNLSLFWSDDEYLDLLAKTAPSMFILNAERRLDSDSVADPSDELELRRVMRIDEPKRLHELISRSRQIALTQALNSAFAYLRKSAILGANQGSMNVQSAYENVLDRITNSHGTQIVPKTHDEAFALVEKLGEIEERTEKHAKYELASNLSLEKFKTALTLSSGETKSLAADLIKPYIDSLGGRLDAAEPVYKIIDKFVTTVNGFLKDKKLIFKLSNGFKILNSQDRELTSGQLSSGEQQLLLLFCYVLTARDKPSVFMIDEPEISLNIKWQRNLVQSLLDITDGASIQFIFASHSMELLSQHREKVVALKNMI